MSVHEKCYYTESHEWVLPQEDGTVLVGLSDYAQNELGDLVFVNLPEVGHEITAHESFADVESVKAVSDVYAPVSGKVTAINEELLDSPEKINEDAYGAWFVRVECEFDPSELMDSKAYQAYLEAL